MAAGPRRPARACLYSKTLGGNNISPPPAA